MARVKGQAVHVPIKFRYIACEQFRFDWTEDEVREFINIYNNDRISGVDNVEMILHLAKKFRRNDAEIAILILDLADRGFISANGISRKKSLFQA